MAARQVFDGGAVFRRAVELFTKQAFVLVAFAFVAGLGSWAFASIMRPVLGPMVTLAFETIIGSLIIVSQILLANDALDGQRRPLASVGDRLKPRLLTIIILPMAAAGLSILGFLLLIVPGLYLSGLLLPMTAIIALEDRGLGAMRRSIDLARPVAWGMVGVFLRLMVVFFLAMVPVTLLIQQAVMGNGPSLILQAGILAVNAALTGFTACLSLMSYLALRDGEQVERVFE